MKKIFFIAFTSILFVACKKATIGPNGIRFYQPTDFPNPYYDLSQNPITQAKFELGRELFYSGELSSDNTISCATCHAQTHAFASHNSALSAGVGGLLGTRNSPAIFNMAWQPYFMWDGGVNHLEIFSLAPITNPLEMNETMSNVITKLNSSDTWKSKFKNAFGTDVITDQQLFLSLTQYMLMIVSDKSKYDYVRRGKQTFTAEEQAGYALFQNKCASCHTEPMLTDYSFRNNGLDLNSADAGRATITLQSSDIAKFKVPTLRNILLTYPYMHDGRFFTIDQVLEHYSTGIQQHENLDPLLANGIPLTSDDKKNLKAFLKTLNDYSMMGNGLLSEP